MLSSISAERAVYVHSSPHRELRLMLTVYADESSDDKRISVFAVAGLMGTDEEWADLESKWKARMGGLVFHAADLECGHGDFKNYGEQERHRWYRDMVLIVDDSSLIPLGNAVDLGDFADIFPNVDSGSPYFLCFHHVVIDFAALARVYMPPDAVAFVFDQNQNYEFNAARLFDILSHKTEWRDHNRLDSITFADKKRRVGLQAADLIARETFKHRHNQLTSNRLARASMKKLAQGAHFSFFTRDDLELIRHIATNDGNRKPLAEYALDVNVTAAINRG